MIQYAGFSPRSILLINPGFEPGNHRHLAEPTDHSDCFTHFYKLNIQTFLRASGDDP